MFPRPPRALAGCKVVAIAVIGALYLARTASATTPLALPATLEIAVFETVDTEPDTAVIRFTVSADAIVALEARAAAASRFAALLNTLEAASVPRRTIKLRPIDPDDIVHEEWMENDDLIEGKIIGVRAHRTGLIVTTDKALAARAVDLLARQGIAVAFNATYTLSAALTEKATSRARALAITRATTIAREIARRNDWRLAGMSPLHRPHDADGKADLGGAAAEPREWGPVTFLTPEIITTTHDIVVSFRLQR